MIDEFNGETFENLIVSPILYSRKVFSENFSACDHKFGATEGFSQPFAKNGLQTINDRLDIRGRTSFTGLGSGVIPLPLE